MNSLREYWFRYRRILVVALAVVAIAGVAVLQQTQSKSVSVVTSPTPAPAEDITVDVQGGVHAPGLYKLPPGSLVDDAVKAAGGLVPQADLSRIAKEINRADQLKDHQKLYLPLLGERPEQRASGTSVPGAAAPSVEPSELVSINTATSEELEALPGIGPVTAQKIIDYREESGPLESIEELMEVSGIGEATFAKLKDQVVL